MLYTGIPNASAEPSAWDDVTGMTAIAILVFSVLSIILILVLLVICDQLARQKGTASQRPTRNTCGISTRGPTGQQSSTHRKNRENRYREFMKLQDERHQQIIQGLERIHDKVDRESGSVDDRLDDVDTRLDGIRGILDGVVRTLDSLGASTANGNVGWSLVEAELDVELGEVGAVDEDENV